MAIYNKDKTKTDYSEDYLGSLAPNSGLDSAEQIYQEAINRPEAQSVLGGLGRVATAVDAMIPFTPGFSFPLGVGGPHAVRYRDVDAVHGDFTKKLDTFYDILRESDDYLKESQNILEGTKNKPKISPEMMDKARSAYEKYFNKD